MATGIRTELLLHVLHVAAAMGATGYVIRRVKCQQCGRQHTERLGNIAALEGELLYALCELGQCACGDVLEVVAVEMVIRGRTNEARIRILSTAATRSGDLEGEKEVDVQLQKVSAPEAGDGVRVYPHRRNTRGLAMPGNRQILRADRQLEMAK